MKKLLFACVAMLALSCSSDDTTTVDPVNENPENPTPENPEPENPGTGCNTHVGDVYFVTQEQVDEFAANNYCIIEGNLQISPSLNPDAPTEGSPITNLSALSALKEIHGSLTIYLTHLVNLQGLENLEKVASMQLILNSKLETLEHFLSLAEIGTNNEGFIHISSCNKLHDLKGFEKISTIEDLTIQSDVLTLHGLENLEKAGGITITSGNLETLDGLESLKEVNNLSLAWNPKLISAQQLGNLQKLSAFQCANNSLLATLPAFPGITKMTLLDISQNPNLTSIGTYENLSEIKRITIENASIPNLNGLAGLTKISFLEIRGCLSLTSISALSNVTTVELYSPGSYANGILVIQTGLASLSGLENITSFQGNLNILENENLSDFCAVDNYIGNALTVTINNNAYNPTAQDIINGNCSQ